MSFFFNATATTRIYTRSLRDALPIFPEAEASLLVEDQVEVAIQVMGKIRARISVPAGLDAEGLEEFARQDPAVVEALEGLTVRKVIAVPDSLVNFVAN